MSQSFVVLALVVTLGGVASAHYSLPLPEAGSWSATPSKLSASGSQEGSRIAAAPQARQAPVPLVRTPNPPYVPPKELQEAGETPEQGEFDKKAAKAAIEADGYKRVIVMSKSANGAWRARAFRGDTEVQLIVDSTGRVSSR
jgi:hypothetical protein